VEECCTLARIYSSDLDGIEVFVRYNEICDCRILVQTRRNDAQQAMLELLKFLVEYGDGVFTNLQAALQILLTISMSVVSCERSFSKTQAHTNILAGF